MPKLDRQLQTKNTLLYKLHYLLSQKSNLDELRGFNFSVKFKLVFYHMLFSLVNKGVTKL